MAGKSKGPKLHVSTPPSHPPHQHACQSGTAPQNDTSPDDLAWVLEDSTELIEELHRSEIFDIDGLNGEPAIMVHRAGENHHGQPQLVIGSPHGGPMFVLTIGRLTPSSTDAFRAHLADVYDREEAKEWGLSLEEFREGILDGHDYCSVGYLAPTAEGRAALGHGPRNCPYDPDKELDVAEDALVDFNAGGSDDR